MLTPDQPYVGGENAGAAVYAYNPWIEARFSSADLPDSQPRFDPAGRPADNNCGVQTNCMSCHAQATYNPNKRVTAPRFTGARYVDLIDPQYVGTLQTDFLWVIPRHAKVRSESTAAALLPLAELDSAQGAAPANRFSAPDFSPSPNRKFLQPWNS